MNCVTQLYKVDKQYINPMRLMFRAGNTIIVMYITRSIGGT